MQGDGLPSGVTASADIVRTRVFVKESTKREAISSVGSLYRKMVIVGETENFRSKADLRMCGGERQLQGETRLDGRPAKGEEE